MVEIQVTQAVRIACDRCGKATTDWVEKIYEARWRAKLGGFNCTEWFQDGCARELWLCNDCHRIALDKKL